MTYEDLDARDQALFDEAGGSDGTFVSARMVKALQGNGNAAIFLSQLMKWSKWKGDEEGWFFRTRKDMKSKCGLSDTAQRTAEKILKSLGLIETDRRGMPAKNHYRLHVESIISLLAGDEQDVGGSGGNKSRGVVPPTSSGGYPTEQVEGGSPDNPIESNTKTNSKSESAHARVGRKAVEMYHEVFPRRANNIQKELIRQTVDDLGTWERVLKYWRGNGHRAKSVKRMLDKYEEEKGEVETTTEDPNWYP